MEVGVINSEITSPEGEQDRMAAGVLPIKPLPFSNGVLKRQILNNHHYRHHLNAAVNSAGNSAVVSYKECLKNHAASLGGHALDGCGEFMASPSSSCSDPTSLKCAACGCHRNFHRRESDEPSFPAPTTQVIEYQPHHRHHPPQPLSQSPNSMSPPPISSSYYPSAPRMLLALSAGLSAPPADATGRKRFRTRFTLNQKEKMQQFAEKVGWRIQKRDEKLVQEFCNEIGVEKGVLKVWMHNNKSSVGRKDVNGGTNILELSNNNGNNLGGHINLYDDGDDERIHPATNGSSSSS